VSISAAALDAGRSPVWLAWVIGIGGTALLGAVLIRMMPPARRREEATRRILPVLGMFVAFAAFAAPSGSQLVLGGVGFAIAALPLLWMGKLPADLPATRDPAIYGHPEYRQITRRGYIAGVALVILEIAWMATCATLS
jgi:hypothetical protein